MVEISKNIIDDKYVVDDGYETFHYETIDSVIHHLKEMDKQGLLCEGL